MTRDTTHHHHRRPLLSSAPQAAGALALLLGCGLAQLGCNEPPPPIQVPPPMEFPVKVEVVDQGDKPVAKVPVLLDGSVVGYTDKDGRFQGVLKERPNFFKAHLTVGAIEGYRFADGAAPVVEDKLQVTKGINGEASGVPLELKARLQSTKNDYLVWVEAKCEEKGLDKENCAGLPVTLDGEEITRTNDMGVAHFVLHEVPGREIKVGIDTPERSDDLDLEPADPVYDLTLGSEPAEIFLVEAEFENDAEAKKPRRRTYRRRVRKSRPSNRKTEPKKTEPKTKPGVINLF